MAECYYCGRRFPQLYKVTAADIQRQYPPTILGYEVACADCLDNLRAAAQLVPQQTIKQVARNLAWMIPVTAIALFSVAVAISVASVQGIKEIAVSSRWIGTGTLLFGALLVWDRTKNRYAFTHDFKWSLNSRRVNLAIAIVIAGPILLVVSSQLA